MANQGCFYKCFVFNISAAKELFELTKYKQNYCLYLVMALIVFRPEKGVKQNRQHA
jgi:hypothetical protein